MEFAHLVYQHWFITCLLLWALTLLLVGVIGACRGTKPVNDKDKDVMP